MTTRLLLGPILFVELLVLAGMGAIFAYGDLPDDPNVTVWALGVLAALAAAVASGLPPQLLGRVTTHGALLAGGVVFTLPFVWLVGTSFKYAEETFVVPPKWLPATAEPRDISPYAAIPDQPPERFGSEESEPPDWSDIRPLVPVDELALVSESDAARGMVTALTGLPVNPESVAEAWGRVYRVVMVGQISVTDTQGRVFSVPTERHWWTEGSGDGRPLRSPNSEMAVSYHLHHDRPTTSVTAWIDRDWLVETMGGVDQLEAVSVPMRQDRTWHRFHAGLHVDGQTWATSDRLYLGDFRWRELTFRRAELSNRDDRDLGIFPIQLEPDQAGSKLTGTPSLTLTIERTGPLAATWAKYTQSYRDAWYADDNWLNYLFNSVLLVVLNVAGQMLACSMVAYAFARLRWPGRDAVFVVLLATMMLPAFVTMIPTFLIFKSLGWYNTLLPLWVPAFFGTPFFIFLLRQFMLGVPRELEEAARIDGCSWYGIYGRIILPLMKPALAAVAIFTFMGTWNEFMGPLIYLSDERNYPVSLGLFNFRDERTGEFGMLMAASTLMTLPVVAVFFLCQRYFIQGVTLTGLKG